MTPINYIDCYVSKEDAPDGFLKLISLVSGKPLHISLQGDDAFSRFFSFSRTVRDYYRYFFGLYQRDGVCFIKLENIHMDDQVFHTDVVFDSASKISLQKNLLESEGMVDFMVGRELLPILSKYNKTTLRYESYQLGSPYGHGILETDHSPAVEALIGIMAEYMTYFKTGLYTMQHDAAVCEGMRVSSDLSPYVRLSKDLEYITPGDYLLIPGFRDQLDKMVPDVFYEAAYYTLWYKNPLYGLLLSGADHDQLRRDVEHNVMVLYKRMVQFIEIKDMRASWPPVCSVGVGSGVPFLSKIRVWGIQSTPGPISMTAVLHLFQSRQELMAANGVHNMSYISPEFEYMGIYHAPESRVYVLNKYSLVDVSDDDLSGVLSQMGLSKMHTP